MTRGVAVVMRVPAVALAVVSFAYIVSLWLASDDPRPAVDDAPAASVAAAHTARRQAAADAGGPDAPIRIGWTAWADAEIVTNIVRRILTERLGQSVELVMADIGIQYQGVATGDLDVMLMSWQPVTHRDYLERVAGDVVDLGPIYSRARLGWAVPAHVPATELASIEDLRDPSVRGRLRGRIHGIDPGSGLMRVSERALAVYGLSDYELVASSGAAMTAALARAMRRDEWIVVTAWNPHWMFARWPLRYLDDPRGVLGGSERVHALVRRDFGRDVPPEVVEFLARLHIPLDELEAALLDATGSSVDEAVDDYLRTHPRQIDYWLTGQVPEP